MQKADKITKEYIAAVATGQLSNKYAEAVDTLVPKVARPVDMPRLDQLDTDHHPLVVKAVQAAKNWSMRKKGGFEIISLVLIASQLYKNGKPDPRCTGYGVGKTHIAKCIQWWCYYSVDGEPVSPNGQFYTAADLMELLGDGQKPYELAPPRIETSYGHSGGTTALIVDDVGTEGVLPYISAGAQEDELHARYFEIVNYCYRHKISLVLTANKKLDELAAHIGGRAWSRLLEMAPAGYMVDLTGVPDYRRKAGGR